MRPRAPAQDAFFWLCQHAVAAAAAPYVKPRYYDVPRLRDVEGGLLIASNHQSFLDPMLIGICTDRPICFLARRSLFRVPGFGALIRALKTHPISRSGVDSKALRTVLRLLRSGEALLIFPEGTRSRDGELGRFRPGVASIAIRCGVPVLPACVEGAFQCWPRTRKLPRPGRVAVAFGEPIEPGEDDPQALIGRVRERVAGLQAVLRRRLARGPSETAGGR